MIGFCDSSTAKMYKCDKCLHPVGLRSWSFTDHNGHGHIYCDECYETRLNGREPIMKDGDSSSGKTAVFDTVNGGSIPSSPTTMENKRS